MDLSANRIEQLPSSINALKSLQIIDVQNNPGLTKLPKELGECSHLMVVDYDEQTCLWPGAEGKAFAGGEFSSTTGAAGFLQETFRRERLEEVRIRKAEAETIQRSSMVVKPPRPKIVVPELVEVGHMLDLSCESRSDRHRLDTSFC